jgi:hypothetical protein
VEDEEAQEEAQDEEDRATGGAAADLDAFARPSWDARADRGVLAGARQWIPDALGRAAMFYSNSML